MSNLIFHMINGAPDPVAPFSHAVEVDGFVFLTGQMPFEGISNTSNYPVTIEDQTHQVMRNLITVLQGTGLNLSNVFSVRIFLTHFNEDYEKLVPFKCSTLDLENKRIMLYEIMKLDNPKYVNKTCMPLRTPFGPSHDKIIKPTIGKKLLLPNDEEVKNQIFKYKKEKKGKIIALQEEKGKELIEKSKFADMKLKEKKEQDELKKRKDVFRIEDLDKAKIQDFVEGQNLEDLIQE